MAKKFERVNNNMDGLEKHLTLGIDKCNREIERLKVDLTESIDQKMAILNEFFIGETENVKSQYTVCLERFNDARSHLDSIFKNKITKIKTVCAEFFSK